MLPASVCLLFGFLIQAAVSQKEPACTYEKDVIVQFHGWKYNDIRRECESSATRFFCAVQISPPIEHQKLNMAAPAGASDPWWQRYNPVSYSFQRTDSGTLAELQAMIVACNANSIRTYVDFEINNMGDRTVGYGSAGNYYQGLPGSISYPGVPYNNDNFHTAGEDPPAGCPTSSGNIEDPKNITQLRFCARRSTPRRSDTGFLNDLRSDHPDYDTAIVNAMNLLIDYGVAGFRFAHARFVDPADAAFIASAIKDVIYPGAPLQTRPFIYQDVSPDGVVSATDYSSWGRVEEINSGLLLSDIFRRVSPSYVMANLSNYGPAMGLMQSDDAVVFMDDPPLQRGWVADWDEEGDMDYNQVLSYRDAKLYEMGSAFMLAHNHGYPRIHSSYDWDRIVIGGQDINEYQGPPRDVNGTVEDVLISADGHSCTNAWNCEHRWKAILGMVSFRNFATTQEASTIANFWSNGRDQIAFSRTTTTGVHRGFVAFNNEPDGDLDAYIYSGLPAGIYCDLVTSDEVLDPCSTGRSVEVDGSGRAHIVLPATDPYGVIAIFNPLS